MHVYTYNHPISIKMSEKKLKLYYTQGASQLKVKPVKDERTHKNSLRWKTRVAIFLFS